MVKIVGLSEEERKSKARLEEMKGIASGVFPDGEISNVHKLKPHHLWCGCNLRV